MIRYKQYNFSSEKWFDVDTIIRQWKLIHYRHHNSADIEIIDKN